MKTYIISLGGSTIVPENVDTLFLKKFADLITSKVKQNTRFIIITGGGKTCRNYQKAAKDIANPHSEQLDWLGIQANYLNAYLLKTILGQGKIIHEPAKKQRFQGRIMLAYGCRPGRSSDYTAVLLAKQFNVRTIINMTNITQVYDKDPKRKDAKPISDIAWEQYRKIIGDDWKPGMNSPFDPEASKLAQKQNNKVVILKGINNLRHFLGGKPFRGTLIHP